MLLLMTPQAARSEWIPQVPYEQRNNNSAATPQGSRPPNTGGQAGPSSQNVSRDGNNLNFWEK